MSVTGFKTVQSSRMQTVIRNSAALVQNQWYDLWTAGAVAAGAGSVRTNIEVMALSFDQAVAGETLEIRIIADNLDETLTLVAVAGTNYYVSMEHDPDGTATMQINSTNPSTPYRKLVLEARRLAIMYRKTTAAGANPLTAKILYELH